LRNWQRDELTNQIDVEIQSVPLKEHNWFVNSQGQTFAVINGPVGFMMGENTERWEPQNITLSRSFAVATHEVTLSEFQMFRRWGVCGGHEDCRG
jgi:hypothetical protein